MAPPRLTAIALALALAAACSPGSPQQDYVAKIAAERAAKDAFFQTKDSPVKAEDRDKFLPLAYFAIDENYAVPAQLLPAPQRETVQMPTSTGLIRSMDRVGRLQFTLKGETHQLSAFAESGSGVTRLFVPFSDLTSGTETYQAGRYMDLDPTPTGIYIVDFNVAYHPYCYYNPEYDCPFPPPENRLKTPIRAGERFRDADITLAR
ncbi:MAG: DUF1684 domain-containing protein [Acidobacteriota bacterium]